MIPDEQLLFPRPTADEVLANLTHFFYSEAQQQDARRQLEQRRSIIAMLEEKTAPGRIDLELVADILQSSDQAINAVISLLGLSQERFLGLLSCKPFFSSEGKRTMAMPTVVRRTIKKRDFAMELARFFLHGREDPDLVGRVPGMDLEKLDEQKLLLRKDALVDSLLRIGLKGRYDARKGDILEDHIEEVLKKAGVQYVPGEISVPGLDRKLDFVVPSKETPYIMIESGLFETTAREQADKSRVEALGLQEIEKAYPNARFVRVTDGVGWLRRGGKDLQNLIAASHYFLVFKTLDRLEQIVRHHVPGQFFQKTRGEQ